MIRDVAVGGSCPSETATRCACSSPSASFSRSRLLRMRRRLLRHQPSCRWRWTAVLLGCVVVSPVSPVSAADDGLLAHWPLVSDGRDVSGNDRHAQPHHVDFSAGNAPGRASAGFDGVKAWLDVPVSALPARSTEDFSLTAWVHTDDALDDLPGDLVSQYDPQRRRGFHLALKTNAGVTFTQANSRQLQFGIDDNRSLPEWTDCGRPGNALLAFALCSFDGQLYAGTCEPGPDESGRVYRYAGDDSWIDCGAPDGANTVTALIEFAGRLYAATGKYRVAGSSLPESENQTLGGRIWRYEGDARWSACGVLPGVEAVGGLTVYRGKLYATSLYRPAGFFRYEGGNEWTDCGVPDRPAGSAGDTPTMRVEALGVFNGWLYATSYDGGWVFRFDGEAWHDCGQLGDNTQTYSFAVSQGRLWVGTWPSGRVFRFEEPGQWTDVGRLGEELEVMGMLVHNGRLIAGTLPLAEVYEYQGESTWQRLTRLDHTPDVKYRRAWTLAEHAGRVFCSTLPSGRIFSWRAGRVAMAGRSLPSGWHHVAAVRSAKSLEVFVDGQRVASEAGADLATYDLSLDEPLLIGRGPNDFFKGRLSDVRLYGRALTPEDLSRLMEN